MAGQLLPLENLPGRFASVSYDAERKMIVVKVDDAEGNLMSEMSWGYSELEIIEEPAAVADLVMEDNGHDGETGDAEERISGPGGSGYYE
ncbi:hypothetical protein CH249_14710 [Rhodococcus sp. 05-2255-3B1]|uniref:hypothetical protein n=1 Tax=unclassified Rhodococcus (in: high G+C Gram-positive bacteria) TaxID=192944 RepID=UPI000B9C1FB6|nr:MULTISPECIES: hypothetical protein [unclassified Rhodococcus (in: high G+C Gram-positive bacteria)]OZE03065.1 hypothetical protein CH250_22775 [Rhodococcus sp. 05-2255-3C]OZE09455.1 hypothetical protein CH249_14710 [Rhodococcus sp. 05-2255-3B1]